MGNWQAPSIGRIVHFVNGGKHVPALITDPDYHVIEPGPDELSIGQALTVFPVGEPAFTTVAILDSGCTPGSWHWPERED